MNIKDRIKSIEKSQYFKQANLHIHSNCSDGKLSFSELVEQGKKLNIKHMAISDHNTLSGWKNFEWQEYDFLIPAVEFDCFFQGVLIHIIGYGIDIDNEEIKSLYAVNNIGKRFNLYRLFKLRNPKTVIEKINQAGGIAVLAHPACYWCLNIDSFVKNGTDKTMNIYNTKIRG